jgi:hypothetical protein
MGIIELIFSQWIERNYRQHDAIQRKEDRKLSRKSQELNQVDELASFFEKRMELAAEEMELWLIENKINGPKNEIS